MPKWIKRNYVWIVEMETKPNHWEPTDGCSLTREDGRNELAEWRDHNPSDCFRLRKYEAEWQAYA